MWVGDDTIAFLLFRLPVGAGVEDLQVAAELLFLVAEGKLEWTEHATYFDLKVVIRSLDEIDGSNLISAEYYMSHWSCNNTL